TARFRAATPPAVGGSLPVAARLRDAAVRAAAARPDRPAAGAGRPALALRDDRPLPPREGRRAGGPGDPRRAAVPAALGRRHRRERPDRGGAERRGRP